jgi:hypothetical protein
VEQDAVQPDGGVSADLAVISAATRPIALAVPVAVTIAWPRQP